MSNIKKIAEEILKKSTLIESFTAKPGPGIGNINIYIFSNNEGYMISLDRLAIKKFPAEGKKYPDLVSERKAVSFAKKLKKLLEE
jgi:hypothetical protein